METIQLKGMTELQLHLYSMTLKGAFPLKKQFWVLDVDLFHGKIISPALSIPQAPELSVWVQVPVSLQRGLKSYTYNICIDQIERVCVSVCVRANMHVCKTTILKML